MPSEAEVSEVLDQLAEYVQQLGDEVVEREIEVLTAEFGGEEITLTGHICVDDDLAYYIGAHPNLSGVFITFSYSLIDSIAVEIPEEHAIGVLNSADLTVEDGDPRPVAAQYLYQSNNAARAQDLARRLRIEKGEVETKLSIALNNYGYPESYNVEIMIFPYEEGFSIKEFYDAVTSVMETGRKMSEVVNAHISLSISEEDPRNTRVNIQ